MWLVAAVLDSAALVIGNIHLEDAVDVAQVTDSTKTECDSMDILEAN